MREPKFKPGDIVTGVDFADHRMIGQKFRVVETGGLDGNLVTVTAYSESWAKAVGYEWLRGHRYLEFRFELDKFLTAADRIIKDAKV